MANTDDQELQDADDVVLLRDASLTYDYDQVSSHEPPQLARGASSAGSAKSKTVRISSSPLQQRIRHFSDNLALMHSSFSSRTSSVPDNNCEEDDDTYHKRFKNMLKQSFRFCFAADSFESNWSKLRFMRFYAAAEDLFLLNASCSALSLFGLGFCLVNYRPIAACIFVGQILVFFLSLVLLHMVRRRKFLSPETSLTVWSSFSMAQLLILPTAIHIVLGGFSKGMTADVLLWSMFSPAIVFLSKFDAAYKLAPAFPLRRLHKAANWEAHVMAHTTFLLAFAVRVVTILFLAVFDSHFGQSAPSFLWMQLGYVSNFVCCPLLLICLARVSRSDFIDRRATFLKVSDAVHFQQVRIEKLVHSMVPEFRVSELREKPTEEWWRSAPLDFDHCTILQMDIAGFTSLSSQMKAEELIDLLNAVYTQIDQAAAYIGNVWKVETIGDCYIAVAGGPLACSDHATRAVALGLCILDIADKISAIAQVPINVRVGIHSGRITVAGFGALMPRCLIFGKDPQIARVLEASGEGNSVHLSEPSLSELQSQHRHLLHPRKRHQVEALEACAMVSYTLSLDGSLGWWRKVGAEYGGLLHFHKDLRSMSEAANDKQADAPGMSYVRQLSTVSSKFSSSRGSNFSKTDSVFSELHSSDVWRGVEREMSGPLSSPITPSAIQPVLEEDEDISERLDSGGGGGRRELEQAPSCHSLHRVVSDDGIYPIVQSLLDGGLVRQGSEHEPACPVSEKQAAMVRCNEGGWLTHRAPNLAHASEKANLLLCERRRRVGRQMLQVSAFAALLQAGTMLLCPWLPPSPHCHPRPLPPPPAPDPRCTPDTVYQALAVVPVAYAAVCVSLLAWVRRRARLESASFKLKGSPGPESALAAEAAARQIDQVVDMLLCLAPLAFLSALDGPYAVASLVWGASTAVLRGTFDCDPTSRWKQWMAVYVLIVVLVVASLQAQPSAWSAGDTAGWKLFLHCLHVLLPTSLLLVPGISCSCQMMTDDRCSEMLLEQKLKTTIREKELLEALVPKPISKRLRKGERHIADTYEDASVCFVYLADLQLLLETQDNAKVLAWINAVQVGLDSTLQKIAQRTQVSKVETFQDFYMVVCGCPVDRPDHSELAIDVAAALAATATRILRPDGQPTALKVGVSSGPLCAGVIGEKSPRWSVFGDTVNTASRMASTAPCSRPDKTTLHISSSTVANLAPGFLHRIEQVYKLKLSKRGDGIDIKGKGFMQTYFLTTPDAALSLHGAGACGAQAQAGIQ